MAQFKIKIPTSLYISKNTKTSPNGEAIVLKNLIPTTSGGIKLRKGHKNLGFDEIDFIATYKNSNSLLLFSKNNGLKILNAKYMIVYENLEFKDVPINYIETNERLLLFFENSNVQEIFYHDGTFSIEEVKFNNNQGMIFYKAVRYRERLYFVQKDSNILYYPGVLAYKGALKAFDVTNIFNAKGVVINIDLLGYQAGSEVFSNLVVIFNSGDILLFDGVDPDSTTDWKATRKISTNLTIYKQSINYASNLLLITSNGLLDIQNVIATNDVANATNLLIPIQEVIKFERSKIFIHKEYIIITQSYSNDIYFFDTRLKCFFSITNYKFNFVETFNDKLIFLEASGIVYEAFQSKNDDGNAIIGEVATSWVDLETHNNKRITFINCGMFYGSGDYNISTGVYNNNNITKGTMKKLPNVAPNLPKWSDITPTWKQTEKLWFGNTLGVYKSIKFSKMGFGRNFSFYFKIESNNVDSFELQDMSIDYDIAKN